MKSNSFLRLFFTFKLFFVSISVKYESDDWQVLVVYILNKVLHEKNNSVLSSIKEMILSVFKCF